MNNILILEASGINFSNSETSTTTHNAITEKFCLRGARVHEEMLRGLCLVDNLP
jgi:hypothetical protein